MNIYSPYVSYQYLISPITGYQCKVISSSNIKKFGFDSTEDMLSMFPNFPLCCQEYRDKQSSISSSNKPKKSVKQEQYEHAPKRCERCSKNIPYARRENRYCSSSCSAICNNTGKIKVPRNNCKQCGLLCEKIGSTFCSNLCSGKYRRKYKTLEESLEQKRIGQREITARYRAKKKNQTPENTDIKAIKDFYKNCPIGYEVDHIIPISKGGPHSLENLQYLTIIENRKKSNKLPN